MAIFQALQERRLSVAPLLVCSLATSLQVLLVFSTSIVTLLDFAILL
jgi:hypothetical protein